MLDPDPDSMNPDLKYRRTELLSADLSEACPAALRRSWRFDPGPPRGSTATQTPAVGQPQNNSELTTTFRKWTSFFTFQENVKNYKTGSFLYLVTVCNLNLKKKTLDRLFCLFFDLNGYRWAPPVRSHTNIRYCRVPLWKSKHKKI